MNSTYLILDELISMLPIILCGCVLPIIFIWMETRRKMNETKDQCSHANRHGGLGEKSRHGCRGTAQKDFAEEKALEGEAAFETALGLHHHHTRHRLDWIWHLPY